MKVFISWSGNRSKVVASILKRWIPDVIQQVEPWVSHVDINAGARWNNEIQKQLSEVKFGILCLTDSNMTAPWVLFEAGALAKTLDNTFVCPYLVGITENTIPGGPLAQFQAKKADREGSWDLIRTINAAVGELGLSEDKLIRAFERWWPELENGLTQLPPDDGEKIERTAEDKMEEILTTVRELKRSQIRNIYITESDPSVALSAMASLHDLGKVSELFQKASRMKRNEDDNPQQPE